MTVKQYLQSYQKIERWYNMTVEQIKSIENDIISIKSPGFDERVACSPKNDPVGNLVCELESEKGRLAMNLVNYRSQLLLIKNQIMSFMETSEEYSAILLFKYVLHKDWKFICDNLKYSRSQANVVHGKALQEFDQKYKKTYETK